MGFIMRQFAPKTRETAFQAKNSSGYIIGKDWDLSPEFFISQLSLSCVFSSQTASEAVSGYPQFCYSGHKC